MTTKLFEYLQTEYGSFLENSSAADYEKLLTSWKEQDASESGESITFLATGLNSDEIIPQFYNVPEEIATPRQLIIDFEQACLLFAKSFNNQQANSLPTEAQVTEFEKLTRGKQEEVVNKLIAENQDALELEKTPTISLSSESMAYSFLVAQYKKYLLNQKRTDEVIFSNETILSAINTFSTNDRVSLQESSDILIVGLKQTLIEILKESDLDENFFGKEPSSDAEQIGRTATFLNSLLTEFSVAIQNHSQMSLIEIQKALQKTRFTLATNQSAAKRQSNVSSELDVLDVAFTQNENSREALDTLESLRLAILDEEQFYNENLLFNISLLRIAGVYGPEHERWSDEKIRDAYYSHPSKLLPLQRVLKNKAFLTEIKNDPTLIPRLIQILKEKYYAYNDFGSVSNIDFEAGHAFVTFLNTSFNFFNATPKPVDSFLSMLKEINPAAFRNSHPSQLKYALYFNDAAFFTHYKQHHPQKVATQLADLSLMDTFCFAGQQNYTAVLQAIFSSFADDVSPLVSFFCQNEFSNEKIQLFALQSLEPIFNKLPATQRDFSVLQKVVNSYPKPQKPSLAATDLFSSWLQVFCHAKGKATTKNWATHLLKIMLWTIQNNPLLQNESIAVAKLGEIADLVNDQRPSKRSFSNGLFDRFHTLKATILSAMNTDQLPTQQLEEIQTAITKAGTTSQTPFSEIVAVINRPAVVKGALTTASVPGISASKLQTSGFN